MNRNINGKKNITLGGSLEIPASKSHTIRALLIASMARGTSRIYRPLLSQDSLSCLKACQAMGAVISHEKDHWRVTGNGGALKVPQEPIDVGNSGTTLYLASALAALAAGEVCFDGDEQIRNRSALPLLQALEALGARVKSSTSEAGNPGCAPYSIEGPMTGGECSVECPTSQYLSALLLAAPLLQENRECRIEVPLLFEQPYVEMTLDWLDRQGIRYVNRDFKSFYISGGQHYKAFERPVPGDFSSATFFFCGAAITGSELTISGLDPQDTQGDKEVLTLLEQMGCEVRWEGDILHFKGPEELIPITMDLNAMPDALPALSVTACFARGETRIVNTPQARMKETDRISCMATELTKLGAELEETPDGMIIRGGAPLKAGEVDGWGDHRIVMALSLAALKMEGTTTIRGTEAAAVTFPEFFELLESILPPGVLEGTGNSG